MAVAMVVMLASCTKEEPFTFTALPSFNFEFDEISAPLGFAPEEGLRVDVSVNLIGKMLQEDQVLHLVASGDARPGVDYVLPEQVVFPKDTVRTTFEVHILKASDIADFEDGKSLILSFADSEGHVKGTRPETRIQIDGDMPSQWIGHNFWFDIFFVPCTKARYAYLYEKLGFIDFSTHPGFIASNFEMLQATRAYLNQQLALDNAERAANGLPPLKDDDGTDLRF